MKLGEVHRGYEFQRVAEESRHGGGENVNDASDKRSDLPESIVFQLQASCQLEDMTKRYITKRIKKRHEQHQS